MQIVIDKVSRKVLRWGYCDFSIEEMFDAETEEVIESDFQFEPDIDKQDWYWNGEMKKFQTTPLG